MIISFKDKSPEKKCNLKSINRKRLPSANSSKIRESFPLCSVSSNINGKNIFFNKYGNKIYIDDNNMQILNINGINQNNCMRNYGRIVIKWVLNHNDNNIINENKSTQSSKLVNSNFKTESKRMKKKKDNYFNVSNKITINVKNDINKSSK